MKRQIALAAILCVAVAGAADNTSVPAANRMARITGPGVLNVLGEHMGTVMILK